MKHSILILVLLFVLSACTVEVKFKKDQEEPPAPAKETVTEEITEKPDDAVPVKTQPFISATTGLRMQYPVGWQLSDKDTLVTFKPNAESPFYVNIFYEENANPENLPLENYISTNIRPKYENMVEFSDENTEYFSIDERAAFRLNNIQTTNEMFDKVFIVDSTTVINITYSSSTVDEESHLLAQQLVDSITFPRSEIPVSEKSQIFSDQGFILSYPDTWLTVEDTDEDVLLKLYYASSSERRDTDTTLNPETAIIKVYKHEQRSQNELFDTITASLKNVTSNEIQIFELTGTEIFGSSWQPQYIVLIPLPDESIVEINTSYSSETLLPQIKSIVRSFHLQP